MDQETPMLGLTESQHLELKGAFSWNSRTGKEDGDLRLGTARSVAAFANSSGGRLAIGVADDGTIHGIDTEVAALFKGNHLDRFQALIQEHLKNVLSPNPLQSYRITIEQRSSLWVCFIAVTPCPGVTYVKTKTGSGSFEHTIYVRAGNRTVKVSDLDRDQMVVERFGGKWSI